MSLRVDSVDRYHRGLGELPVSGAEFKIFPVSAAEFENHCSIFQLRKTEAVNEVPHNDKDNSTTMSRLGGRKSGRPADAGLERG